MNDVPQRARIRPTKAAKVRCQHVPQTLGLITGWKRAHKFWAKFVLGTSQTSPLGEGVVDENIASCKTRGGVAKFQGCPTLGGRLYWQVFLLMVPTPNGGDYDDDPNNEGTIA